MGEVIIKGPRMMVVLYEREILDMLKKYPDIWATALKRGKGVLRYEISMARKG